VEANNQNVLTIAATNAPWDVDPALRRSGRFSKTIYVPEPDFISRREILKMHAKKRPVNKGIPFNRLALATFGYSSSDLKGVVEEASTYPWKEAFFAMEKMKKDFIAQGKTPEEADTMAKEKVKQRNVTTGDFLKAIRKRKSTLPPWYEQAKKQIGKQEELTMVDGKEHKKITESKMGPGEKEAFKDLLKQINKRNQWWHKTMTQVIREIVLILPFPDIASMPVGRVLQLVA
jgi:SpoVK/Ycf46/Vps4 family AAA+-type ATPase